MPDEKLTKIKKIGLIGKIARMVSTAALIFACLILIDRIWNNRQYGNLIVYGRDCNYKMPEGFKIEYSPALKKYAIKFPGKNDDYLWTGNHGFTDMPITISQPDLFGDTCAAKAALKAYFHQQEPKINDFK